MSNSLIDKKAEIILRSLKKFVITHNIPEWHQTDKWRESKNIVLENICEFKAIARIYGVPYDPQHQVSEEVSNRIVSLPQQKTTKRKI